jgi:hypothetical protein
MNNHHTNDEDPALANLNHAKARFGSTSRYFAYSVVISLGIFGFIVYMTSVIHKTLRDDVIGAFAIALAVTVVLYFVRRSSRLALEQSLREAVETGRLPSGETQVDLNQSVGKRLAPRPLMWLAALAVVIVAVGLMALNARNMAQKEAEAKRLAQAENERKWQESADLATEVEQRMLRERISSASMASFMMNKKVDEVAGFDQWLACIQPSFQEVIVEVKHGTAASTGQWRSVSTTPPIGVLAHA